MRRTLKDIARLAGVSKVTVHKAIHGKPGVSEETRLRVMGIVRENGYVINPNAASLKREKITIAVITLDPKPKSNYFHRILAKGVDDAERELSLYRVVLTRHFSDLGWQSQADILERILAEGGVDGVVIYCNDYVRLNPYFARLEEAGVPVVTMQTDAVDSRRVASVTAPDERSGRLAAELMDNLVRQSGSIVVLGGNKALTVLRNNVAGFFAYMQENRPDLSIFEINDFGSEDRLESELERLFNGLGTVRGLYSNSARNNIPLCDTVFRMWLAGKVAVLTNDVYPELRPYFEKGVINATMWQDPKSQARQAIHLMYEYLTTKKISPALCSVRIGIVMRENFEDYCD